MQACVRACVRRQGVNLLLFFRGFIFMEFINQSMLTNPRVLIVSPLQTLEFSGTPQHTQVGSGPQTQVVLLVGKCFTDRAISPALQISFCLIWLFCSSRRR